MSKFQVYISRLWPIWKAIKIKSAVKGLTPADFISPL